MKVALVHDYLNEFGGAERVLLALSEIFPDAPIYTAFYKEDSQAYARFKGKKVIASWAQKVPYFATKLHSPLRFLAPFIWGSFDFSDFDLVIASSSWYVTKGFKKGSKTVEICYCHTPPRYLYGYPTSVEWQKYWFARIYASFVNHFMRVYDFEAAQKVDYFIANSKEVQSRIKKFYRRDSEVIYPPVELVGSTDYRLQTTVKKAVDGGRKSVDRDYFLVVSRIVGGKGLTLAVEAAGKLDIKLKVVGKAAGYGIEDKKIKQMAGDSVEFLGYVSDEELVDLYSGAKAFLALATDEDFGMTPVEAMLCGTPVIAYNGGGYKETVIDGKTGLFFEESSVKSLIAVIEKFLKSEKSFDRKFIAKHAQMFSNARFKKEILDFVKSKTK